jgi:acetolactate synthase-1/2/3 large subunit
VQASERLVLPVATPHAHYVSFPTEHAHHLGDRPERLLGEADFVLVLDTDVPWCPLDAGPPPSCAIVEVGADPLHAAIPVRSHRADVVIQSGIASFLEDLLAMAPAPDAALARRRGAWIASRRAAKAAASAVAGAGAAPTPALVARALGDVLDDDTVLVNELSLPVEEIAFSVPGSYYRSGSASGLGWAIGCALGIKLCSPAKKVVSVVGDGVYYLANPLAAHWIEAAYALPTLTVVLNNGVMGSIRNAVDDFYPRAGAGAAARPLTSLEPALPFHEVMRALGGHGEVVDDAGGLTEALARCQAAVGRGTPALLNVLLDGSVRCACP